MSGTCFKCGRRGHWAATCDQRPCSKCLVPLDLHTEAGIIECAWRGMPCAVCGNAPHPELARDCAMYISYTDSDADRQIRSRTAWHRDADPDTFYRLTRNTR